MYRNSEPSTCRSITLLTCRTWVPKQPRASVWYKKDFILFFLLLPSLLLVWMRIYSILPDSDFPHSSFTAHNSEGLLHFYTSVAKSTFRSVGIVFPLLLIFSLLIVYFASARHRLFQNQISQLSLFNFPGLIEWGLSQTEWHIWGPLTSHFPFLSLAVNRFSDFLHISTEYLRKGVIELGWTSSLLLMLWVTNCCLIDI